MFWKTLNDFRYKNNKNFEVISLDEWYQYFSQTFRDSEGSILYINVTKVVSELDSDINLQELEISLKKCKNKKASGFDGISNEFYKNLPQNWKLYVLSLFNKIMEKECVPEGWSEICVKMIYKKGQVSEPCNYRPISLLNCLTKIFTQILFSRLSRWCESKNLLPEFQSGFRQGRSCRDNTFVLNCVIQSQLQKQNGNCLALFIDFKQAFPSVNQQKLWSKLASTEISTKFIRILDSLYRNAEMKVRTSQGTSEPVKITKGVLQGEVLSPILFSLFIADLEEFLIKRGVRGIAISSLVDILILAYADDLIILVDNASGMMRALKVLKEYCEENNLVINTSKTKIMVFKRGGRDKKVPNFYFGKELIEVVKSYEYLGVKFTNTALFDKAANKFYLKAKFAMSSCLSLIRKTKLLSWNRSTNLFCSLVSSVLLYNCEIWSVGYMDLLERIQVQFFKNLLPIPYCTPGYAVRLETGRLRLSYKVFAQILNWISKIQAMPSHRLPKVCLGRLINLAKGIGPDRKKYNWVALINSNFFEAVGESEMILHSNRVWSAEDINRVLAKYENFIYNEDLFKLSNSSSLIIYRNLTVGKTFQWYLDSHIRYEVKSLFAQLRLLNVNCLRLKIKNNLYKLGFKNICEYCNIEGISFSHYIIDCLAFYDDRRSLMSKCNLSEFNYGSFINILNSPKVNEVNLLAKFIRIVLERGVREEFFRVKVL